MRFERIATDGGAILYDPTRTGNAAGLFDLAVWRERGQVTEITGGRGSVFFLDDGAQQLVLRRYRRGGLVARFSRDRYLWLGEARNRAFRELRLLGRLLELGLPVPVPVAAAYIRRGLGYQASLVTLRLPGSRSLAAAWLAGDLDEAHWCSVGRCIRRFHDAGVEHPDLNAHNIMLGQLGEVWLLDFDRARLREPGRWHQGPIERLARSLAKIAGQNPHAADWRPGYALLRAAHDRTA